MADYAYSKRAFIARMEKIEADFYRVVRDMDLENVTVREEMLEVAAEVSKAVADAKASLPY